MCRPASIVLSRDRAYYSRDGDSHEDIITEHHLHADGVRGPTIVRVEVVPPNGDYSLPLQRWVYRVDQDELPDWYDADDADDAERRARVALAEWAAHHIIRDGRIAEIHRGQTRILLGNTMVDNEENARRTVMAVSIPNALQAKIRKIAMERHQPISWAVEQLIMEAIASREAPCNT